MRRFPALFSILLLSVSLAACRSEDDATPTASPTAVVAIELSANQSTPISVQAPPAATLPPLRFVMPTPGAEPVSGWRPPLYPLPWAISPHDHFYFARPIPADQINWPLADYRYGGVFFAPNIVHTGVDIPAKQGTTVLAAAPGTVVWADWGLFSGVHGNLDDPYGMAVAMRQDFGYQGQALYTIYAHMMEIDVTEGQWLDTGDQIGLVGNTGQTTGPHLHFEVRLGEDSFFSTYNPELWMAPPQGWGVLAGRIMDSYGQLLSHHSVEVRSEETGRVHTVRTYGGDPANSDPYYNENLAMGDLLAGVYKITLNYEGHLQQDWVTIYPGQVTYFTFRGSQGFTVAPPPTQATDYLPVTPTPTSTAMP